MDDLCESSLVFWFAGFLAADCLSSHAAVTASTIFSGGRFHGFVGARQEDLRDRQSIVVPFYLMTPLDTGHCRCVVDIC
jgi:hypothetical protein